MTPTSWGRAVLLLLICLAFTTGCGPNSKARAKVKGRVKFFDKYLTCGTVAFRTQDGRQGAGYVDFEGNYEVNDAPIGECAISVSVPEPPKGPGGTDAPKPPPGVPEAKMPGSTGGAAPMIDPSKIVSIPPRYADTKTSGLTFRVEAGDNTHNITLSP